MEAASLTQNCLYERYIVHGTTVQYSRSACRQLGLWTVPATVLYPYPYLARRTKRNNARVLLLYSVLVLYRMYLMLALSRVMKKCRRRSYEPGPAGVPCRQGDGATERLQFITVQCVGVLRKLHRTVVPCRGPELLVNRQSSIVSSQAWAA